MTNKLISKLRGVAPFAATGFALLLTVVVLARVQSFYTALDLLWIGGACVLELVLLELFTQLVFRLRPGVVRVAGCVLIATAGSLYVAQMYSIWISGGMIPPIAFANNEVAGMIAFNGVYILLGAYLLAFLVQAIARERSRDARPALRPRLAALVFASLGYVGLVFSLPLARGIMVERGEAPVSSFVHSLATYAGMSGHAQLSAAELNEARATFSRRTVYEKGFPAQLTQGLPKRPNIILIFTEGMSARWMDTYGSRHEGVTPNLDELASKSLVFTNYYNHTAATFRGLRGQLTSGHQQTDGYNADGTGSGQRDSSQDLTAISRVSLPDVLRGQGYRSMFFLSQQEYLNKMIETLGFDRTLGRDYLYANHLGNAPDARPKFLSDEQLFDSMLLELESLPTDKPFFAAAYNFETHAFRDGELKYADASNPLLNRFHTYDRDVGAFVRKFMASPLHDNTLLIFTADHSTYPGPHAMRADERVHDYFVDTIPLLMYWKGVNHNVVNVAGKNSLALAPSVLSLLGVREGHTLFLGCTLFESCALDKISNIGREYVLTDATGSYSDGYVPKKQRESFEHAKEVIERYKAMDLVIGSHAEH